MSEKNPWKVLSSKAIYDNPWINVTEYKVINPRGGEGIYGKVTFKNYAIGIIPLDEDNSTWLVGQYRFATNEYSWEIPMGGGPSGMSPLESAKRELEEETGLTAKDWKLLMKLHTSNSVCNETGFVYVASELTQGKTQFDETEDLKIKKVPFEKVVEMALTGEITDAISVAAILKVAFIQAQRKD